MGSLKNDSKAVWFISNRANVDDLIATGCPVFWAQDVKVTLDATSFNVRTSFDDASMWPVHIPAPGVHLIRAGLFALAVAYASGLDMDQAAAGLSQFSNISQRQEIVEYRGLLIMDDSYNASPESMFAAMETLNAIAGDRRKLCALGDMLELGQYTEEHHLSVGRKAAECGFTHFYLIGESALYYEAGAKEINPAIKVQHFTCTSDLAQGVIQALRSGDCLLIKGSNRFKMKNVLDLIKNCGKDFVDE